VKLVAQVKHPELDTSSSFPAATRVEITEGDHGYYYIRYGGDRFAGDSYFFTLEERKSQGKFEFNIDYEDWIDVEI